MEPALQPYRSAIPAFLATFQHPAGPTWMPLRGLEVRCSVPLATGAFGVSKSNSRLRCVAENPDGSNAAAVAFREQSLHVPGVLAFHGRYCSARVAQVMEPFNERSALYTSSKLRSATQGRLRAISADRVARLLSRPTLPRW